MRDSQYRKQLKKIRVYCKLIALRLKTSKSFDPEDDALFSKKKLIKVSSNQPNGVIICAVLHEIGHYIDAIHHPKEFYGRVYAKASNRLYEREVFINERDYARKKLAEMNICTPTQLKALEKVECGEKLTAIQEEAYLKLLVSHEVPKKYKIAFVSDDEIYDKFKLTPEEYQVNINIETRAWDFGETVSELLGIKLPKEWEKERRNCIKQYGQL